MGPEIAEALKCHEPKSWSIRVSLNELFLYGAATILALTDMNLCRHRQANAPLTPTVTPRSTKFGSNIFDTPTFDSILAGEQADWDPPSPLATQQQQIASKGLNIHVPAATNAPKLSKSRKNARLAKKTQTTLASPVSVQGNCEYTLRTPPPTRSGGRRKVTGDMARNRKASTPGAMRPPETPNRRVQASPQLFSGLQFSPDPSGFLASGPLTAPAIPPRGLFWDSADDNAFFSSAFEDSFNPDATPNANPFMQSPSTSQTLQPQIIPSLQQPFDLRHVSSPLGPSSSPSHFDGVAFAAPFTASPRIITSRPDDPGLFLSSPARRFGSDLKSTVLPSTQRLTEKEAYHHQIEESRREQEERARRGKPRREVAGPSLRATGDPEAPLTVQRVRPGIKRNNTHSGIGVDQAHARRQSQVSFSDTVSYAEEHLQPTRGGRSSPLKRPFSGSPSDIERPASRNRVSWSLAVDADGRARPIAKPLTDTVMEDDTESETSSISFREDDFDAVQSRPASFAFSAGPPLTQSALLRVNEPSHSKSSSYSSAFGSSNSTHQSSRTSSVRAGNAATNNGYRAGRAEDLARTISPEKEPLGDAQQALRAMKRERAAMPGRPQPSRSQMRLQPPPFNSSPPIHHSEFEFYGQNISPTTITDPDLATPSTDRDSQTSGSTRCVCSATDSVGNTMIQW